jgi:putative transposase
MSRPHRLPRFDYCGPCQYFITMCTFDRQDALRDPATADDLLQQLRRIARRRKFAVLAYCVMPDHLHLLIEGTSADSDCRRFVKNLKQSSGQRYAASTNRHLWQEGYYDRILRSDDDPRAIARYIVENPLLAGLVQCAADYPFSGSEKWTLRELIESVM